MLTVKEAESLVQDAFRVGMLQSGVEARDFALFCSEHEVADFIELGTSFGGSFYLLAHACKPGLRISLDMPWNDRQPIDYGYEPKFKAVAPAGYVEILGDIHEERQKNRLAEHLNGRKVDLIFADADHSYEGAKRHFEMYREFIKPGEFFAMHDVGNHHPCQAWWDENEHLFEHWKFIEPTNCYGIGVWRMPTA